MVYNSIFGYRVPRTAAKCRKVEPATGARSLRLGGERVVSARFTGRVTFPFSVGATTLLMLA
jgi:hypothetical protein